MRFDSFQVTNYRNVIDSGPINVTNITGIVGQNEAGKSNLFEALYRVNPYDGNADYNIDEDWPVDKWGERSGNETALVCVANFAITCAEEISDLYDAAFPESTTETTDQEGEVTAIRAESRPTPPDEVYLSASRFYGGELLVNIENDDLQGNLEAQEWVVEHLPKFVYIHDFEMTGSSVELDQLAAKFNNQGGWDALDSSEQTIKIVLDLANINLDDFLQKGNTAEGRTTRTFDKKAASSYLSSQFKKLWSQKEVRFDIEIDGTTLNIFAEDEGINMPVRLNNRSTGFRWHVAFAWKFTHASQGEYKNCVLLLEEPGIHLHYSGQKDLLDVFEQLCESNTILYSTHLASMVDPGFPERVRIVESNDHHATVTHGIVSKQQAPMAVIETCLGLTSGMGGLLGNRWTLIVEGGTDALILQKLSTILSREGQEGLSDRVHLWPAKSASKTPMYAGLAIGQGWDAGVLLDSDEEGITASKKIHELYVKNIAKDSDLEFRVLMLAEAAGLTKKEAAIEDLFPDEFYMDCVNEAYKVNMSLSDLEQDSSEMITHKVDHWLQNNFGGQKLDKDKVLRVLLTRFDGWESIANLPEGTAENAERLFSNINSVFAK